MSNIKELKCPKDGGELVPFGKIRGFVVCLICGVVYSKDAAEEHAVEAANGEKT